MPKAIQIVHSNARESKYVPMSSAFRFTPSKQPACSSRASSVAIVWTSFALTLSRFRSCDPFLGRPDVEGSCVWRPR